MRTGNQVRTLWLAAIGLTAFAAAVLLAGCGGKRDNVPSAEADAGADKATEPAAVSNKIFDMPYLVRDLDNGLRVIIVPTDYPDIISLQIPVQTGARNEVEPGKSGFAHFFEHMMFRGTEAYPAEVYADILKKAGADQNAYTTNDYTNYYVTFTKADLERILELEADRFQRLKYTEEQFRTEALAVKGEYLKNFSNPLWNALERLNDLMFTAHTYKHTPMGFIEDIEAMPDQMAYSSLFFDRWYRPEKTVVILVGDLDADESFRLVEKYWGGWERGNFEVDIPVEPPLDGPRFEHLQLEVPTQPWYFQAYRGPAYEPTKIDMPALDIVSSIYFSESSDLYRKLVIQDQAVDQLSAYFPNQKDPGLLMIYARLTDAANVANVRDSINAALAKARTELLSDRKVQEAKSRLRYAFTANLDNSTGIAAMLARFVHFSRMPETVNEVYDTYASLTPDDIRDVANKFFVDSQRVTLTLSNDAAMEGIDGKASVDALVAAAGMADGPAGASDVMAIAQLPDVDAPDSVAVQFMTEQSAASPLVDVAFLVHTGAGFDPEGKKGLAALTAAMISDGGSEALSIEEINEAMYPIASGFGAQVDKEMTRLSGQVHKDNLATWYELVRGQLLFPAWSDSDFSRIKTRLVNSIREDLVNNNDEELGKEVLYAALYGPEHPYGSYNFGSVRDLEAVTLDDVKAFYRDNYTVANITVGLAGGYPDGFPERIGNDLQKLRAGERTPLMLPAAPAPHGREALLVEKETPAVAVSFGFPIELTRGDPDWVALWLVRSYFGEHRSVNGHLYQRLRKERGMNYGDYAYIEYFPRGMFMLQPNTNLGRQQQIFQVWLRPLRDNNDAHFATRTAVFELQKLIDEGISESDFETTRAYLSKYVSLLMDGQSRQLGYALDGQYYETGNFADYVRDGLNKLTLDDVNRVIRENLQTDDMQFVFVTRDAADLQRRLSSDQASPMTYAADKSQELLEEDSVISTLPLEFADDKVTIVSAEEVFQ